MRSSPFLSLFVSHLHLIHKDWQDERRRWSKRSARESILFLSCCSVVAPFLLYDHRFSLSYFQLLFKMTFLFLSERMHWQEPRMLVSLFAWLPISFLLCKSLTLLPSHSLFSVSLFSCRQQEHCLASVIFCLPSSSLPSSLLHLLLLHVSGPWTFDSC